MVSYQEEMRGSIGRIVSVDRTWDQSKKIWPTITVDVRWRGGMSGGPVFNESGEVVGIVSRGVDTDDEALAFSTALWLEPLPYSESIYGPIDPRNPGWIVGWGTCNATSTVDLFQTREEAEAFVSKPGNAGLSVRRISTLHPMRFEPPRPRGRR
jgi:serine protease Do